MLNLIDDAIRHWELGVVSGGVVWGASVFFVKKWVSKAVDTQFDRGLQDHKLDLDKLLEDHKQKLNLLTENERFNFQRKVTDFNLYTNKRHSIYPELYKFLWSAHKAVVNQFHGNSSISLSLDFDKSELDSYLEDEGFPSGIRREMLNSWDGDRQRILSAIIKVKTNLILNEYKNFIMLNELYITENITEKAWSIFQLLNEIYFRSRNDNPDQYDKVAQLEEKSWNEVNSMKKMMRDELSIADYEK